MSKLLNLLPGAIAPVPVNVPADEWDNIVRAWGVGYCCEWFGHQHDSEFSQETARVLQERTDAAAAEWRPIATAPKDGTRIALLGRNGKLDAGKWYEFRAMTPERREEVGLEPGETGDWDTDNGEGPHTHWRPL